MIKVVIQGASGIKNSGDEAILQSILQKIDLSYDVKVITFNVEYSERLHPGISFIKLGSAECRRAVLECDLFILGGGGLLQDETSIYNVSRWLRYLRTCIKEGKKTFLYANSIGPIRFQWNKAMIKKYLKRVDRITVRDELSFKQLKNMGITENVTVTADPVFSLQKEENINMQKFMLPERYATICVRHWYDTISFIPVSICSKLNIRSKMNKERYDNYISCMAWLADYIIEKYNMSVVFLPFLYYRDGKVADDIQKKMKHTGNIVQDEYLKPEEAMEIIKKGEFLIGMRLHSIIYAAISGVPACVLAYSLKVRGMAEYLKIGKYTIDMDDLSREKLADTVNDLVRNKEQIRNDLKVMGGIMRQRERKNQEIFQELLQSI